MEGVQNSAPR